MNNTIYDPRQLFKQPWYYNSWFIFLLTSLWFLILPAIGSIILLILKTIDYRNREKQFDAFMQNTVMQNDQNARLYADNTNLYNTNQQQFGQIESLNAENITLKESQDTLSHKVDELSNELNTANQKYADLKATLTPALQLEIDKLTVK